MGTRTDSRNTGTDEKDRWQDETCMVLWTARRLACAAELSPSLVGLMVCTGKIASVQPHRRRYIPEAEARRFLQRLGVTAPAPETLSPPPAA